MDADRLYTRLLQDAQRTYRDAVASQVEGRDATRAWDAWESQTAAILLAAWSAGALRSLRSAKVDPKVLSIVPRVRFDRMPEVSVQFEAGPAREVVDRFVRLMPMTRDRWEALVQQAKAAAAEIRADEQGNALQRILARSPDLAAVANRTALQVDAGPQNAPEEVRTRRKGAVQAAVQGGFFVTGMTQEQVEDTQSLLAQVIRGTASVSAAGKEIAKIGIGDFVGLNTLQTGTDLTAARLETVYRTNVNRAQSQGQLDICRDPVVRRFVPLMQFSATKDKRTRPTHKQMHGYVATTEQIDAMGIPTPLGFNCRCSWNPVSIATAVGRGWCDEDGNPRYEAIKRHNGDRQALIDKGLVPDVGFISG